MSTLPNNDLPDSSKIEHILVNRDTAIEYSLKYFNDDNLASNVFIDKYALYDEQLGGYLEKSPQDMFKRINDSLLTCNDKILNKENNSKHIDVFNKFIFGGSGLAGIGNDKQISSLGNCFFVNVPGDSYASILKTDEMLAQVMKRRGGCGATMEYFRPKNAKVNNSAKTSTGAVSYMDRFSNTTKEVSQAGRRGALMLSMHVNHPDVEDFIICKDDLTKITGANISVKITDQFMNAVINDSNYTLTFPVDFEIDSTTADCSIDKNIGELFTITNNKGDSGYAKIVKAKNLWELIVKMAHKNAEPGVLFWDNIIKESPADCYSDVGFETRGTNPCGELPLSSEDSCRLGAINLYNFVSNPFTDKSEINYNELKEACIYAQHAMDAIVTLEEDKLNKILESVYNAPESDKVKATEIELWSNIKTNLKNGRRTGIGVLGWADMLAALNIKYASDKSLEIAKEVYSFIAANVYIESINMAEELGAFPVYDYEKEKNNPFINRILDLDIVGNETIEKYKKYGRRNIASLTVAPTGSLGLMAQCSSGIEPVFMISHRRRRKIDKDTINAVNQKNIFVDDNGEYFEEYNVFHKPFIDWYKIQNNISFEAARDILSNLSLDELSNVIEESPYNGSESHNIDYLNKVKMQGIIQKYIDHSISITHNLPADVSLDIVSDIYMKAWEEGCKGCTIYRDGSRSGVIISNENKDKGELEKEQLDKLKAFSKRPKELEADYYSVKAKGKSFAVIVGKLNNEPYEIFAFENPPSTKNTTGHIIKVKKNHYKFVNGSFEIENLELHNENVEEKSLTLTCSMLLRHNISIDHIISVIGKIDENLVSFSSAVRRVLTRYNKNESIKEKCPDCTSELVREEGCIHCTTCSYSRCG